MSISKAQMSTSLTDLMQAAKPDLKQADTSPTGRSFGDHVTNMVESLNSNQVAADQSLTDLVQGKTENVHNVVLSVVKADMSFRMALELRNKLTEAYQEIMRMQV